MTTETSKNLGEMREDNTLFEFFAAIINDMREQNTDTLTITASLHNQIVTFDITVVGVKHVVAEVNDEN